MVVSGFWGELLLELEFEAENGVDDAVVVEMVVIMVLNDLTE